MSQMKFYIHALVCCICWLGALTVAGAEAKPADAAAVQTEAVQAIPDKEKLPHANRKEEMRRYDPAADRSPAEDIPVVETNFSFAESLLVRPDTKGIVIHHVGVPSGDTSAEAIHKAHLAKGWAGIGYHYVIRKDGTIERGRPLAAVGAHAQGHNFDTVGINVTGNFDTERPTAEQLAFKAMQAQAALGAQVLRNMAEDGAGSGAEEVPAAPNAGPEGEPGAEKDEAEAKAKIAEAVNLCNQIMNGGKKNGK